MHTVLVKSQKLSLDQALSPDNMYPLWRSKNKKL